MGLHRTDFLKFFPGSVERVFSRHDVAGELVDGHDLVELRALEGYELHVRVLVETAGGEDAVAQHKEILAIDVVVRRDAFPRFLDARYLSPVFEQDMARFGSDGQRFGMPLSVGKFLFHNAKII